MNPDIPAGGRVASSGLIPIPSTSHPLNEPGNSSNLISFYSVINPLPFMNDYIYVMRMISSTQRQVISSIPVRNAPYMHSFGLSQHHAIIFAAPVFINMRKLFTNPLQFHANKPMRIYVTNIHDGTTQR